MFGITDMNSGVTLGHVFPGWGLFIFLSSWLWGSARTGFVVELESLQEAVEAFRKSCSTSVNPFLQRIQLIWKFQLHGHHLYIQQKRFFVVEKWITMMFTLEKKRAIEWNAAQEENTPKNTLKGSWKFSQAYPVDIQGFEPLGKLQPFLYRSW